MLRALSVVLLAAGLASAQPRPVDDAEREAAVVAAAFLAEGPRAVWSRLSSDAPLRALAEAEALAELAARLGPRERASWSLQTVSRSPAHPHDAAFRISWPSGTDEAVLFRMKREGPRWTVREVLTSAELPPLPRAAPEADDRFRMPLLIAAMVLAVIAALVRSRRKWLSNLAVLAAAGMLATAVYLPSLQRGRKELPFIELRALVPLREALARGDDASIPRNLGTDALDVARLWILHAGIPLRVPGTPADPLGGLGPVKESQLASLVRARIALVNGTKGEARTAFDRAIAVAPVRDDLILDAATSFQGADADHFLGTDLVSGARDEELYYERARSTTARGRLPEAREYLRAAWALRPLSRETLVRDPRLFPILADVSAAALVSLHSAEEPLVRSRTPRAQPLALPSGTRAATSAEFLRLAVGNATLDVPGGAAIAPPETPVVAATHWAVQEEAAALEDVRSLLERQDRSVAPGARTRVSRAANALANHNRWQDLVALTGDIRPDTAAVPPELLVLRITALLRTDRSDEARALAEGDAVRSLAATSTYPDTLLSLADAMAGIGSLDTATRLYGAVKSKEHATLVQVRLRQLELRRALVQTGQIVATDHFDIRHPSTMNPAIAMRIGDLLEAELARLRPRLPQAALRRIIVNVLTWDDFRGGFTGSDHILGLYDGEILFPFAVVNQFKPEVVRVITHELVHALVAQATSDNAPRWFQEGIAQTFELVPYHPNVFHTTPPELVLPLPLLDALMENAADTQATEQGYTVAQTFVRFLTDRHGAKAASVLIEEFRKGRNTDDALHALTGKSADALNREFREWGFRNNGNFRNTEPFPYGHLYSPDVDPRIREGFRWKR
jgi:hypothetical protein